jgi:hypothetical protein
MQATGNGFAGAPPFVLSSALARGPEKSGGFSVCLR